MPVWIHHAVHAGLRIYGPGYIARRPDELFGLALCSCAIGAGRFGPDLNEAGGGLKKGKDGRTERERYE